jgi:hypothetical protein
LREESGLNPRKHQDGGGPGRGIAQWTLDDRWADLVAFARRQHKKPTNFNLQLQFVWHELSTSYRGLRSYLRSTHDLQDATRRVMNEYEGPDPRFAHYGRRLACARRTLHGQKGGRC